MTKSVHAVLAFSAWLALAAAAVAAVAPMTVAELTAGSTAVVQAEITSVSGASMPTPAGSFPFLLYRARTVRAIDGAIPVGFSVRVPGRMDGGRIVTLPDGPPLAVGRAFVLFLRPASGTAPAAGVFEIVGFSEGALPVVAGREPLVLAPASAGRRDKVRLHDLSATVRAARNNQAVKP